MEIHTPVCSVNCSLLVGLILFLSCETKHTDKQSGNFADTTTVKTVAATPQSYDGTYFWNGNINSKIPIFLWLTIKDSLIQGEVTYTKAKRAAPIKLLGNIDREGDIRVCEYQKDGMITGVFLFKDFSHTTQGTWVSTKDDTELVFQLSASDTLLRVDTGFEAGEIGGDYSYAYGEKGYQGGMKVVKIADNKIAFDISSTTGEPSLNIAEIETDTVIIVNNQFVYKVPGSDSCLFRVTFLKDFAFIDYENGYRSCENMFGLNATIDGIFYKIK